MPYTIDKTNGVKLTVVEDGKLNLSTDLQLVGKNYAGYGQVINENLIKLLENFANGSAPMKPLSGQLWYDSLNKKIKFYTGSKWNQIIPTTISSVRPSDLSNNEYWFDSINYKLYLKHNDVFRIIGGNTVSGSGNNTVGTSLTTTEVLSPSLVTYDVVKLQINDITVAIISDQTFEVDATDPTYPEITKIFKGITLIGADPITGISSTAENYFWGTAADSLKFDGKDSSEFVLTSEIDNIAGNATSLSNITYISSGSPSTAGIIEGAWSLSFGSTLQATYADLAERYAADAVYEPGTVLMHGGPNEVTLATIHATTAIAGIVSTNPAYMMNSAAGNSETHPYIALKGRVPCKVIGPVRKGELLVASGLKPGYATARQLGDDPHAVIGKALEDCLGPLGTIEVKV